MNPSLIDAVTSYIYQWLIFNFGPKNYKNIKRVNVYGEKFSEGECQNSNVLLVHSSFTLDDITSKKYEYDVVFSLQRHSSGLGLKELFFYFYEKSNNVVSNEQ